jgi:hypothetical protein
VAVGKEREGVAGDLLQDGVVWAAREGHGGSGGGAGPIRDGSSRRTEEWTIIWARSFRWGRVTAVTCVTGWNAPLPQVYKYHGVTRTRSRWSISRPLVPNPVRRIVAAYPLRCQIVVRGALRSGSLPARDAAYIRTTVPASPTVPVALVESTDAAPPLSSVTVRIR